VIAWVKDRRRAVIIDNVSGFFDDPSLAGLLTSGGVSGRELGRSGNITGNLRALILLTANNPSKGVDMLRRIVQVNIESGENPTHRSFSFLNRPAF
jgi:hypothetical protein